MRISRVYLFRACYCKGVWLPHLHLAETQSQVKEQGCLIVEKPPEGFRSALVGIGELGVGSGEAGHPV